MVQLKFGDRINCCINDFIIVSPYQEYTEVATFEIIANDAYGYYLYVPNYMMIKGSSILDYSKSVYLNVDKRFVNEKFIYISENLVFTVKSILDGMSCKNCNDFFIMAKPNQPDDTLLCWSCRTNIYR